MPDVLKLIHEGHRLAVDAYDRSQTTKLASGSLLTVDNQIDTTTGTLKAKAVFDNKDGALFPNQFVNVRLILEQRPNALVIPASALQQGNGGDYVYVVKPGNPPQPAEGTTAAKGSGKGKGAGAESGANGAEGADEEGSVPGPKRPPYYVDVQNVTVDLTEGAQVILKGGVKPGDNIVVDGQEKLKRYSKVDPKAAAKGTRTTNPGDSAASSGSGADGSTPQPDAGQGGLDEPRGHKGKRGNATAPPDASTDSPTGGKRQGKRQGSPQ